MRKDYIIAALIIASGMIVSTMFGRYEFSIEIGVEKRIDRLTGQVETCWMAPNTPKRCQISN